MLMPSFSLTLLQGKYSLVLLMTINTLLVMILICAASTGAAAPRIAVLDFELNDITSLPNTPEELRRTSTMAPLLSEALNKNDQYQTSIIPKQVQKTANGGFGYLFQHLEEAAKLGQTQGVDWIIVSQHSKPSFLFSYLWVYLIKVTPPAMVIRFDIELKGSHETVTQHAIASLANKIQASIVAKAR